MIENRVKVQIPSIIDVLSCLSSIKVKFIETTIQKDMYYDREEFDYLGSQGKILKIRVEEVIESDQDDRVGKKTCMLTYKERKSVAEDVHADHGLLFSEKDGQSLMHIIRDIGFKIIHVVDKRRMKFRQGENVIVYVDDVISLGKYFMVIKVFPTKINDLNLINVMINDMMTSLGLSTKDIIDKSYLNL